MISDSEIKTMAEGIKEHAFQYDVEYGRNAYNECRYCDGRVYHNESVASMKHSTNCPFAIAVRYLEQAK